MKPINKFFVFMGILGISMLIVLMSISISSAGVANLSSEVGSSYICIKIGIEDNNIEDHCTNKKQKQINKIVEKTLE